MSFNPLLGLKNQGGPLALTSWGPTSCKLVYKSQQLYKHHKPEFIGVMKWLSYCKRGPVYCSTYFHGAWGGPRVLERNMPLPFAVSIDSRLCRTRSASSCYPPGVAVTAVSQKHSPKSAWFGSWRSWKGKFVMAWGILLRNDEKRASGYIWIRWDYIFGFWWIFLGQNELWSLKWLDMIGFRDLKSHDFANQFQPWLISMRG
jgi:hypothetical protein